MHAFLSNQLPRSVQGANLQAYKDGLKRALIASLPLGALWDGPLYGVVYYFHRYPTGLDADNLSKPVWDSFEGVLYDDDRVIQLRQSGLIDLRVQGITGFDVTRIPDVVLERLLDMLDNEEPHVLYVEIGRLDYPMYRFGLEL